MRKFLVGFSLFLVIGCLLVAAVGGYFGLLPFAAGIMGAKEPKDLGIEYSEADYDSYMAKLDVEIIPLEIGLSPEESIRFEGETQYNQSFSQEEITARLNYAAWKYMPLTNIQVRIGDNGAMEVSGVLRMDRLDGFFAAAGTGYTSNDVAKGMEYLKLIPGNFPIYMSGSVSVQNNRSSISVQSIQVGRVAVPLGQIDASGALMQMTNHLLDSIPGMNAQSVIFDDGMMAFEGSAPTKVYTVPGE